MTVPPYERFVGSTVDGRLPDIIQKNIHKGRRLKESDHVDNIPVGFYWTDMDTVAATVGLPAGRAGNIRVYGNNEPDTFRVQVYYPFRENAIYTRWIYGGVPHASGWQKFSADNDSSGSTDEVAENADPTKIVCMGDSLTEGYSSGALWSKDESWPGKLQALLPNATVTNRGFSGATSDQLGLHMGWNRLLFNVPEGKILGSGTTTLTSSQEVGQFGGATAFNVYGYVNGLYGALKYDPVATSYTFTRAVAGSDMVTNVAMYEGRFIEHRSEVATLFIGRNDITKGEIGFETDVVTHILKTYRDVMEWYLKPERKSVLLMGTITRTDETPNHAGYKSVMELNQALKDRWPGNVWLVQDYITSDKVWSDTGITPNQDDLAAQSQKMSPPSLFDDVTHYNKATAEAIAKNVAFQLRNRGWTL